MYFVQFMMGEIPTPDIYKITYHQTIPLIRSYAKFAVQLSNLSFSSIGSLTSDNNETLNVGPLISLWVGMSNAPWYKGPYKSQAERYTSSIDIILHRMVEGDLPRLLTPRPGEDEVDAVFVYLILRAVQGLIRKNLKLNETAEQTYIKHGYLSGPNLLVDAQGSLTSIIDWEWLVIPNAK